jgi:hypothetical protein
MLQTKVMQESKQARVTFAGKLSHLYFSLPPLFALCAATVAWSQPVASFSGPHPAANPSVETGLSRAPAK